MVVVVVFNAFWSRVFDIGGGGLVMVVDDLWSRVIDMEWSLLMGGYLAICIQRRFIDVLKGFFFIFIFI